MLYTKHSINISLCPSKAGKQSVRIRVTASSLRIDIYTGISLLESQWDKKKQQVKQGCIINDTPYNIINKALNDYKAFILDYFNNCAMRDVHPSLTELKERFNKKYTSSSTQDDEFFFLYDQFIKEKSEERGWHKDMTAAHKRLRDIIKNFQPDIKFSDLSTATMNKLLEHMSKTMYNEALKKRLTYLNSFVTWAKGKKYAINEEFFAFNPKLLTGDRDVRHLNLDELAIICTMKLPLDSALDRVRDMFVFQCFTALRYSDIAQLKHKNITLDTNNNNYILDLVTEKDEDRITFPLPNKAMEVYLKYRDRKYPDDLIFPVLSNQKYNAHLKELGKLADLKGTWKSIQYRYHTMEVIEIPKTNLSSHTARRTFITNALNENIDLHLISIVTSHSDTKSMQPYITKTATGVSAVINAMNEIDKKISRYSKTDS